MAGYTDDGDGPKLWLIFGKERGLFWREGGCGYTSDLAQAGLFSESFARRMTGPSYADKDGEARHLSSFRYVLDEATARARTLAERFARIPQKRCECPGYEAVKGPYPSGFCRECGEWYPPKGRESSQAVDAVARAADRATG